MSGDGFEGISHRWFLHHALIVATATQFFPGLERTLLAQDIPDVAHIRRRKLGQGHYFRAGALP
jgi:hypothetical protein